MAGDLLLAARAAPDRDEPDLPPGYPGVRAAVEVALARAVVLVRAFVLALVAGLTAAGAPAATALLAALVLVVTVAELRCLPRLGRTQARFPLLAGDASIAVAMVILAPAQPPTVVFGAGTALLAGTLAGFNTAMVWLSLAGLVGFAQAPALSGTTPAPGTWVWSSAPSSAIPVAAAIVAVVLSAGLAGALGARQIGRGLVEDLARSAPPGPTDRHGPQRRDDLEFQDDLEHRVVRRLRRYSLARLRLPWGERTRDREPADMLTRRVVADLAPIRRSCLRPVHGIRFDTTAADYAVLLEELCRIWSDEHGGPFDLTLGRDIGSVEVPAVARRELAEILDEALKNAVRRAGAERIGVHLRRQRRGLVLTVRDDGAGFDPHCGPAGLRDGAYPGISAMARSAAVIGATLSISSQTAHGTVLVVRAPW